MIRAEDLGGPGRTSRLGSGGQTVSIKRRVRLRPRPRGRGVHSEAGPTRSCRDPSLRPRRRGYAGLQDRDGCGARGLACCGRGSFLRGGLCRRPIRIAMRREALGPSNGETGRPRTQLRGEPAAESSRRRDQSGRRGPGGPTRRRALRTALHPKPPFLLSSPSHCVPPPCAPSAYSTSFPIPSRRAPAGPRTPQSSSRPSAPLLSRPALVGVGELRGRAPRRPLSTVSPGLAPPRSFSASELVLGPGSGARVDTARGWHEEGGGRASPLLGHLLSILPRSQSSGSSGGTQLGPEAAALSEPRVPRTPPDPVNSSV